MEMSITQKLQTYITAELGDAALYRELAQIAPNHKDRTLLLEFASDEQRHAEEFLWIYWSMTGNGFNPPIAPVQLEGSYRDILRDRVLDESGDFRKYGNEYIHTTSDSALKNAYDKAKTDENVHALRLLYLLSE